MIQYAGTDSVVEDAIRERKNSNIERWFSSWSVNARAVYIQQMRKLAAYTIPKDKATIVGATDLSYAETTIKTDNSIVEENGLTAVKADFTSYPDRAVFRLKNELGYDLYLTRFQVMGNRIVSSNGKAGSILMDQLRREDDIRRNGENLKEISNDYIFDATQVATIADYWYKRCGLKKHMYQVSIKGFCPWFEPGDRYTLTLGGGLAQMNTSIARSRFTRSTLRAALVVSVALICYCANAWNHGPRQPSTPPDS